MVEATVEQDAKKEVTLSPFGEVDVGICLYLADLDDKIDGSPKEKHVVL